MANLRVNQLPATTKVVTADLLPVEVQTGGQLLRKATVAQVALAVNRIAVNIAEGTARNGSGDGWNVSTFPFVLPADHDLDASATFNLLYSGSSFGGDGLGFPASAGVIIDSIYWKDRQGSGSPTRTVAPILTTHGANYSLMVDFVYNGTDSITVVVKDSGFFGGELPAIAGYIDYAVLARYNIPD